MSMIEHSTLGLTTCPDACAIYGDIANEPVFEFDDIVVSPGKREILKGGAHVQIEPKAFDVLLFLIENRTRVVSKDELLDQVWAGRIVSDATLASSIKVARRMVGDNGEEQQVIRTHHGRGFRFVAKLGPALNNAPLPKLPDAELDEPAKSDLTVDLTLPSTPSIAIIPFAYLGDGPDALLSTGLTRDITVGLARTRWLFVTAPASSAVFTASPHDPREIGKRLGVRYILRGTILQSGDRFRLTITLCDALSGAEIWADRIDSQMGDIFSVQDQISRLVIEGVTAEINIRERQQALMRPFEALDAWSAYHQAINLLFKFTPADHDHAESLLNLAARLEPNSARVFAAKSFLSWQRAFMETTPDRNGEVARAHDAALHSTALDPLEPMAHWALGRAELLHFEYANSINELRTAIELNPSFASGHYTLAFGNSMCGQSLKGFESVDLARRISPYDPMTFAYLAQNGAMKALTGEPQEGAIWIRRALQQPQFHYHIYALAAWVNEAAGQTDDALDHLQSLRKHRPDYSMKSYFRAFPFVDDERRQIEGCFKRLGLAN